MSGRVGAKISTTEPVEWARQVRTAGAGSLAAHPNRPAMSKLIMPCGVCSSRKRTQSRSHHSRQSALFVDFGGDASGRTEAGQPG